MVTVGHERRIPNFCDDFDRYEGETRSLQLRKNFVVEQALLYFMEARRELPDEAFIPTRIRLSEEGFDSLVSLIENPPPPTDALRELMRGKKR